MRGSMLCMSLTRAGERVVFELDAGGRATQVRIRQG